MEDAAVAGLGRHARLSSLIVIVYVPFALYRLRRDTYRSSAPGAFLKIVIFLMFCGLAVVLFGLLLLPPGAMG